MIHIFNGSGSDKATPQDFAAALVSNARRHIEPFDPDRLDVINEISKRLLLLRDKPALVALGYWLRASAIKDLQREYLDSIDDDKILVPRGIALHFPPNNVDTLFVYSWSLAFILGNTSIVKLPSVMSADTASLINLLTNVLSEFAETSNDRFIQYDYDNQDVNILHSVADLRLIWGGDEKVEHLAKFSTKPDGLTLGFSNRTSLALVNADVYIGCDDAKKNSVAASFFNDVFWFDQQGCGSPRLIFWFGQQSNIDLVKRDFIKRLAKQIEHRGYQIEASKIMEKFVTANNLVASGSATSLVREGPYLDLLDVTESDQATLTNQGGGFLLQHGISEFSEMAPWLTSKTQTVTYFGLTRDDVRRCARVLAAYGGYRLVPMGEALNFSHIWDGVDLIHHLTRCVIIKSSYAS
jgi:hypothetical protein